jgi:hypothetical protein
MVIRFINMEVDLRVQYVSFPPPTSDLFLEQIFAFFGNKIRAIFF